MNRILKRAERLPWWRCSRGKGLEFLTGAQGNIKRWVWPTWQTQRFKELEELCLWSNE